MPEVNSWGARFRNRIAVVVGGAAGIGRAAALRLAAEGADVLVVDADRVAVDDTVAEIRADGGTARAALAAVDDLDAPERVLGEEAVERIDVLVNHQSEVEFAGVETSTIEGWERNLRANLSAPFAWARASVPRMKQHGGAIVNIGSVDGIFGNPHIASYSAAKGGIVALTHVMAAELARYNIRVNCVARVGTTDDEERSTAPAALFDQLRAVTPLRRLPHPRELAAAIAFLASADASYITGSVLVCDGGRTAVTPGTA